MDTEADDRAFGELYRMKTTTMDERDRLQAQVDAMTEEIERLKAESAELLDRNAKLAQECGRLEAERDHWKAAFEEYGDHDPGCRIHREDICTCGMDAARKIGEEQG